MTHSLKFNQAHWVRINALEKHWEEARVTAERTEKELRAATKNVRALSFVFTSKPTIVTANIDGQTVTGNTTVSAAGWQASFQSKAPSGGLPVPRRPRAWRNRTTSKAPSTTPSWTRS